MDKAAIGAFLMIVGVIVIGANIYIGLHGMPAAVLGFGAGGASFFVGYRWVQGKSANGPG